MTESASPSSPRPAETGRLSWTEIRSSESFLTNHSIHGVELGAQIGWGPNSVVYSGTWQGEPVALKLIHVANDHVLKERLTRSVTRFKSLHHQHILKYLFSQELDGIYEGLFMVVTELATTSLEQAIRDARKQAASRGFAASQRPISSSQLVIFAHQMARALAYLHSKGLIHRDVKPSNILWMGDESVYRLADFDFIRERIKPHEQTGFAGTFRFVPPEGLGEPSADIFALGVTLSVAATGKYPWPGSDEDSYSIDLQASAPDIPQHLPRELRAVIEASLSVDPNVRPAADDLAKRLSKIAETNAPGTHELGTRSESRPLLQRLVRRVASQTRERPARAALAMIVVVAALAGYLTFNQVIREEPQRPRGSTEASNELPVAVELVDARAATDRGLETALSVANVTRGDERYSDRVLAKVDDVLKIQLWYGNYSGPYSGTRESTEDLRATIDISSHPTDDARRLITAELESANLGKTKTQVGVDLSLDDAFIEVTPNTTYWRHNVGTNPDPKWVIEEVYQGNISGEGVPLEDVKPGEPNEATLTVLLRVRADAVGIKGYVRPAGDSTWHQSTDAVPGDELEYLVELTNEGNTVLENVHVRADLAPGVDYLSGSTSVRRPDHTTGSDLPDGIVDDGVDVGDYPPGESVYVSFRGRLPNEAAVGRQLDSTAVIRPSGMNEYWNTMSVTIISPTSEANAVTASGIPGTWSKGWTDEMGGRMPLSYARGIRGTTHPQFNSFVDTPNYGDERAFFDAKPASHLTSGGFKSELAVDPGDIVYLRVYIHNNAGSAFNGDDLDGPAVARNTRARVLAPDESGTRIRLHAYIASANSRPRWISDSVDLISDRRVQLAYLPGSASLNNNAHPQRIPVSDSVFLHGGHTDFSKPRRLQGAPLGFKKLNGLFPGCFGFEAILTMRVRVLNAE